MEDLLKKYIISVLEWEYVDIQIYNIDGSTCSVNFYTDEYNTHKEYININIWEMLEFLNTKNG